MQIHHLDHRMSYDGSALRPRFIYETTGVLGTALLSFVGPCDVGAAHMVDLEDVRAQAWIKSEEMLHFLIEIFDCSLLAAVGLQRLLADHARKALESLGVKGVIRDGDDLFDGECKLSVSIAAPSVSSSLIHFGINISSRNTPVKTRGLADYGIDPKTFIDQMVPPFVREFQSMREACFKVKDVSPQYPRA